jgi:hypothetical protein
MSSHLILFLQQARATQSRKPTLGAKQRTAKAKGND